MAVNDARTETSRDSCESPSSSRAIQKHPGHSWKFRACRATERGGGRGAAGCGGDELVDGSKD